MSGIEVYIVVGFSFILGTILGALLYNCVRGLRAGSPALAPVKAASTFAGAFCVAATADLPVSSQEPPNMAAWRRLAAPSALAPRFARGAGLLGAIDAQTAEDILPRRSGASMAPLPRPAAHAGQPGKLIRMSAA